MTKIAVAGATGRAGHHAADVPKERGTRWCRCRAQGVDVITGDGLDEALAGVVSIIGRAR